MTGIYNFFPIGIYNIVNMNELKRVNIVASNLRILLRLLSIKMIAGTTRKMKKHVLKFCCRIIFQYPEDYIAR